MFRRLSQADPLVGGSLAPAARWRLLACASGLLALLVVARCLVPDPEGRGFGTHQQLGLPPCTFYVVTGWRCPTCGMTTAWSHVVRGQWRRAVRASACGTLSALLAALSIPYLVLSAVRRQWVVVRPSSRHVLRLGMGMVAIMMLEWVLRLVYGAN
jgi:hypothetical protein